MKKLHFLYCLFICIAPLFNKAQVYNNEWIDFSKTYYKFKVGKTGLYRINQNILPADIAGVPVQQFQLWRNGQQVALYTSVATGVLPANGYIEFWAEQNDGIPDNALYLNPANQLNNRISLQTDTAAFFLTINTNTTQNLRYANGTNNVAGNTLTAEPYFIHEHRVDFKEQIVRGYGENYGERVTSSSYDVGEGWGTRDIRVNDPYNFTASNLFPASVGSVQATLRLAADGVSYFSRNINVKLNNTAYISNFLLPNQQALVASATVPSSAISNGTNNFAIEITASDPDNNRISASYLSLTYPRLFNFGGANQFVFSLPASANPNGTYIEITNFNSSAVPILYDRTNNLRYVASVNSSTLRFALPFSSVSRSFVLVSQDALAIQSVTSLQSKTFTNFSLLANQANYLIVSNKLLGINAGGAADLYRQYRASAAGGGFNAKLYDIDELVDQFAFGIKKHPLSVKNFVRFAKNNFSTSPSHIFIIGKGVTYDQYRLNEATPFADRLNLVPTFGWPASDALLVSDGLMPQPLLMVGRLAAMNTQEVNIYLQKVKEHELHLASNLQTIDNKLWSKHVINVAGANDPAIEPLLIAYLNTYKGIMQDTLFGAKVFDFNTQATGGGATPATTQLMKNLFADGISMLTYFGHSAATQLDYNLNNPNDYNNPTKYPMFLLNGCNAGNFFDYDTSRVNNITSFAEKFVIANQRGAIGVIASSHYGLTGSLHNYSTALHQSLVRATGYKNYIGKNMLDGLTALSNLNLFVTRMHAEQFLLHGDPAIVVYAHNKPDFVIEDKMLTINPSVLTVADTKFNLKTKIHNIGKAQAGRLNNGGDSVHVIIKWQHGNGLVDYLYKGFMKPSVRYADSIVLEVPINAARDAGNNCITVIIDSVNHYDELSKTNNVLNKCFFIFENDVRPVYPYNYSIVNTNTSLFASTSNPLATTNVYTMEMDTTTLFNSAFKITRTVTSAGGVIEFNPQITYRDSTVYYWRVAAQGSGRWNGSSFMYLNGTEIGFNQSHLYQHLSSNFERIKLDSFTRSWSYAPVYTNFTVTQGIFPNAPNDADYAIFRNGLSVLQSGCSGYSVRWTLFDPITLKPYYNQAVPSTVQNGAFGGFMGSSAVNCNKPGKEFNFEFSYNSLAGRNAMRDFIDWIPNNVIAIARINLDYPHDADPVAVWKADATPNGGIANTLYGKLVQNGFTALDDFNYPRPWIFMFKKNNSSFTPTWKFGFDVNETAHLDAVVETKDSIGYITSPVYGPATQWKQLLWRGARAETALGDEPLVDVIGITATGSETVLFTGITAAQQNFSLLSINASTYPYLKLRMSNKDVANQTPYQLRYWRVLATLVPEGALSANVRYNFKDTLDIGEPLNFAIAFKNISNLPFTDSIKANIQVTSSSNVVSTVASLKLKKPLNPGDTATVIATIPTNNLRGLNTLFVEVNPNGELPEQFHFNNFLYKNFFVRQDDKDPALTITFDGVQILNGDVVSAKPVVRIQLKDESKFMMLNDTAGITVQLRYPDNTVRRYQYGSDTLKFLPAQSSSENTAVAEFTPVLPDGEYELIINGKDMSGNLAGNRTYNVLFNVDNKPAISDVFNYPNPFSTSTAFVFTLTGTELPSNIRIQIMTVTGKIVKEINQAELGPIRIGRNITEYKWDGTDMYGQKLANGVYLYRIITNLNGSSLGYYNLKDRNGNNVKTDKYFKGGYGKMYLMR